jgi:hypothetical protein
LNPSNGNDCFAYYSDGARLARGGITKGFNSSIGFYRDVSKYCGGFYARNVNYGSGSNDWSAYFSRAFYTCYIR